MRPYELMVLLSARLEGDEAVETLLSRVGKMITDGGGMVKAIDRWGRRRLAYEIDGMTEGYYAVFQFDAEPSAVAELNRVLRITEGIVRHIIVRPNEVTRRARIAAASRRQPVASTAPAAGAAGAAPAAAASRVAPAAPAGDTQQPAAGEKEQRFEEAARPAELASANGATADKAPSAVPVAPAQDAQEAAARQTVTAEQTAEPAPQPAE
ncbi:MAG: 30S ribosomal protein S6 [Limnochordaceae bacterium]|nr:30S ribosomal protein S6 [Limnochordaceae bacterium]